MVKLKQVNVDRCIRIAAKLETVLRDSPDYREYMQNKPNLQELKDHDRQRLVEGILLRSTLRDYAALLNTFFDNKKKYEKTYIEIYDQLLKQCAAKRKLKKYDVFLVRDYLCDRLQSGHPLLSPTCQNYNHHFDDYFDEGSDMYAYDEVLARDGFNSLNDLIGWEIARQLDKPD